MTTFHMQAFWNQCRECGARFTTLALPAADDPLLFDDGRGAMRYLHPLEDPVWKEARALFEEVLGRPGTEYDELLLFHRFLARTVDAPESGVPFGSAAEMPPCPRCGSRDRAGFGPISPARFEDVDVEPVSHTRWNALDRSAKLAVVRSVLAG